MEGLKDQEEHLKTIPLELLRSYRQRLGEELGFVCRSRPMKHIKSMLHEYSTQTKAVTIVGQIGTGRRTVARAIHLAGPDWWRPFIEADLSGIEDENALKFLFGRMEEHFFTGTEVKQGIFSAAARSTICLKNFDMYSDVVKREVETAYHNLTFAPLGGKGSMPLECRLIFTLQCAPAELKRLERIEEDVYKMLVERVVNVPPLSGRKDDIIPLAEKFIEDCSREFCVPSKKLSKEAERWLKKAPWNKNVGHLKKSVYSACFNTSDGLLYPNHFALAHDGNIEDYQQEQMEELSIQSLIEMKLQSFLARLGGFEAADVYDAIITRVEEPLIRLVLDYAKGNQIRASRMLGINRNTLRAKLNKYNIKAARGKGGET